jgi:hypothetical protein
MIHEAGSAASAWRRRSVPLTRLGEIGQRTGGPVGPLWRRGPVPLPSSQEVGSAIAMSTR